MKTRGEIPLKKQSMEQIYRRTRSQAPQTPGARHEAFNSGYADGLEWLRLREPSESEIREIFKPFNNPSTVVVNELIGTKRYTRENLLKLAVIMGVGTKHIKAGDARYHNALRNYDTGFEQALAEKLEQG